MVDLLENIISLLEKDFDFESFHQIRYFWIRTITIIPNNIF